MNIEQKSLIVNIMRLTALAVLLMVARPQLPVSAESTQAVDSEGVISEEAAVDYRVTQTTDEQSPPVSIDSDQKPEYTLTVFLALALLATGYYALVATKISNSSEI